MSLDRRRFLVNSSAVGGLFFLENCKSRSFGDAALLQASGQKNLRVRRAWNKSLAPELKKIYAEAVKMLKANDKNASTNEGMRWSVLAAIHQNSCPHSNWYFLPWHRMYLQYFEAACQTVTGNTNFALPYWNWTADLAAPADLFDKTNFPSLVNLRDLTADKRLPEEFVGPDVIEEILATDDFYTFASGPVRGQFDQGQSGQLEGTPHNRIHVLVGQDMATFLSPVDPIFWLHHCNVDRLWAEWTARHPKASLPYKKGKFTQENWLGFQMSLLSTEDGKAVPAIITPDTNTVVGQLFVKDVLSTQKLGYIYDTDPSLLNAAEAAQLPPPTGGVKSMQTSAPAAREISEQEVDIPEIDSSIFRDCLVTTLDLSDKKYNEGLDRMRNNKGMSVTLITRNIAVPSDPEIRKAIIRFFILTNANQKIEDEVYWKSLHEKNAFKNMEYAGSYSFFTHPMNGPGANDASAHNAHGQQGGEIRINLTRFFARFKKTGAKLPGQIRVVAVLMDSEAEAKTSFPFDVLVPKGQEKTVNMSLSLQGFK